MALIDYRILQNGSPSLVGAGLEGYDQGMQARDRMNQRRGLLAKQQEQQEQKIREQAFQQNLNGLLGSYGQFAATPEGKQRLFEDMSKAGFGREMMGLMGGMPEAPKPVQQEYQFKEFGDQAVTFNPATGEAKQVPGMTKPAAPTKYQMVKNRKGIMEPIDPTTGLNPQGKLVEAWIDPREPKGEKALTGKDVFGMEQQLRTQYLGQTKDFRDVRDAFGRIKVSAKDPSAAGDLSLIFNYMKMLDPGSTVREGEFATAAASGSLGDRFVAAGQKLVSGQRLDPSQRADFLNRAQSLYAQQQRQMEKAKFETRKMASSYPGLNPDRILMDAELAEEASAPAGGMPTHDQYDSLPSGAEFTDPDGNVRRKP